MTWITQALRKLNVLPEFTEDDVLNALNENDLREHAKALDEVQATTRARAQINHELRNVLMIARHCSSKVSDLERNIKREITRVRETSN